MFHFLLHGNHLQGDQHGDRLWTQEEDVPFWGDEAKAGQAAGKVVALDWVLPLLQPMPIGVIKGRVEEGFRPAGKEPGFHVHPGGPRAEVGGDSVQVQRHGWPTSMNCRVGLRSSVRRNSCPPWVAITRVCGTPTVGRIQGTPRTGESLTCRRSVRASDTTRKESSLRAVRGCMP